jgi:hypothetical protein
MWTEQFGESVLSQFLRVRKIAKSDYYRHFCPSAWNISDSTVRIFVKVDIWVFFDNVSRQLKVSLQSDNNNGYFI